MYPAHNETCGEEGEGKKMICAAGTHNSDLNFNSFAHKTAYGKTFRVVSSTDKRTAKANNCGNYIDDTIKCL